MIRSLLLGGALLAAAPTAQAAPQHAPQALLTLAGAYAGCGGGALVGMGAYGLIDPWGRQDAAEWLVIGAPAGCALGGVAGGTITHALVGSPVGSKVFISSGILGLAGAGLLIATPGLYENFDDTRFVTTYVTGLILAVVGVELTAFGAVLFGSPKDKGEGETAGLGRKHTIQLAIAPEIAPKRQGLRLIARF